MKTLTAICLFAIVLGCSENKTDRLDFIIGIWKMEGKEQYEVWEMNENQELIGYSYKLVDNEKLITETLSIKIQDAQIFYEATVPDQNDGKTIRFNLNNEIKTYLSFENSEHDFPKKIQYEKINDTEIKVTVSGDEGKGFSYKQFKQKPK